MGSFVRRSPFVTFTVLAFLMTWAVWVPRALVDQGMIGGQVWVAVGGFWSYGPAIAAVLAAGIVGGRGQLRELGSRLTRVRVGWRWYAVVVFGPALAGGLVAGLSVMLGSSWIDVRPVAFGDGIVAAAVLFVVLSLTDGLGEEVGWRGYALPRLLERLPAVRASLLLGVVWAAWHLPLFWTDGAPLEGSPIWVLFLRLPATAIIFTWVFQHTKGSTVIAVLLHGAMNLFASPVVLRPAIIAVAVHWLIAVGLVAAERQERPTSKRGEPTIAGPPATDPKA